MPSFGVPAISVLHDAPSSSDSSRRMELVLPRFDSLTIARVLPNVHASAARFGRTNRTNAGAIEKLPLWPLMLVLVLRMTAMRAVDVGTVNVGVVKVAFFFVARTLGASCSG